MSVRPDFKPDQLLMTPYGLLATSGRNGMPGELILLSRDMTVRNRWRLRDAKEIEGVILSDETLMIANDAYFHRKAPYRNQIIAFRTPEKLMAPPGPNDRAIDGGPHME